MKKLLIILLLFISTKGYNQVDLAEFPVGHPNYSNVASATDQLRNYPAPRYKFGHTLLPNFNWIDPQWASGRWQSGVTDAQAVTNSVDIQTELARNWNYYFMVSWSVDNFNTAWKNACNANSSFKIGLITLRAQTHGCNNSSCMWCQCLAADHYLNNASGQLLDVNGNVTSVKEAVRPTAPLASFRQDGINARGYISSALSGLNRPVNMVNENGEVYGFLTNQGMMNDPQVTTAKNASGLDWENYLASRWRAFDNDYRDQFMSLPILAGAKYTEYRLGGHREYQFRWEQMKFVNSQITGNYYSTEDFYVRYPYNWKDWQGPWHGLRWITESRHYEIAAGDKLFSPFIAAGWDRNEELNVRPAQWLGLLKLLNIYGAEFFYSGFFNENFSQTNPPPNPKGYAWQAVIPSYAQAITSQAEDILRTGNLMAGDMIDTDHNPDIPLYQFNTGATNKVVAVRNISSKYWITGTIQNSSNVAGSTPINSTATFTLAGEQLTINIRRHGSTYIYDKSNPNAKVFYQLDGWHQYEHPSRWTKDIEIEAEVYDNTTGGRKSYLTSFPNLTSFKTVVALTNNQTVSYSVFPRETNTKYLFVKASGSGTLEANFNGTIYNFNVSGEGWYKATLGSITATSHNLILKSLGSHEIDSINVTSNSTKYPTTVTPPCTYTYSAWSACSSGTQTRTVVSSSPPGCTGTPILSQTCTMPCTLTATVIGATSACTGTTTSLTVNDATSYQWSNGATTQGINVLPGTYTVTITQGVCTATDSHTITGTACPTCTAPTNIAHTPDRNKVSISWTKVTGITEYIVEIKSVKRNFEYTTTNASTTYGCLVKATAYTFTVGSKCSDGTIVKSQTFSFTTLQ